jgi:Methyltransferase domain
MIKPFLPKIIWKSPLRWHFANKVTRIEVIQRSIDALGAERYMEIGVADGTCFCALRIPKKVGIDPIAPAPMVALESQKPGVHYFALTSDEFFKSAAPQVLASGVDVVFIDGLHTFGQAYRDCLNSLRYLKAGGLILIHDCLPTSEADALPAQSWEEALRINGPSWNGLWVGDVWKAMLVLRAQHSDLQACVLDCDHGVGLVYAASNDSGFLLKPAQIDAMTYADLTGRAVRLLGVRRPAHVLAVLKQLKKHRTRVDHQAPSDACEVQSHD